MQKYLRFLLPAGAFLVMACGNGDIEDQQIEPTFSAIQENVFKVSCTASSCHGEQNAGNLDLRTEIAYDQLVNRPSLHQGAGNMDLVKPGVPEESFLYIKITNPGPDQGGQMPPGFQLPQPRIDAVKQWIAEGAENN